MKKKRVKLTGTPCCGEPYQQRSGLWVCPKCNQILHMRGWDIGGTYYAKPPITRENPSPELTSGFRKVPKLEE